MMASTLLLATVAASTLRGESSLDKKFDPTQMSDTQMVGFIDNAARHVWTSFIHGWYKYSQNGTLIIDD